MPEDRDSHNTAKDTIDACDAVRARNRSWKHPFGWLECLGCYYVSSRARLMAHGCSQVNSHYKRLHKKIRDEDKRRR